MALATTSARADAEEFGLEGVSASLSSLQAGGHSDFTVGLRLKPSLESARDLRIGLPPGLIANPNAVPRCTLAEFDAIGEGAEGCPFATQIGIAVVESGGIGFTEPIYNMVPPADAVARLGLYAGTLPSFIEVGLRSGGDFGLLASIENVSEFEPLEAAELTLWGEPAAGEHDTERLTPLEAIDGATQSPPRPVEGDWPFMQNPTSCGEVQKVFVEVNSYEEPERFDRAEATLPALSGCGDLAFLPEFSAQPTSREAGSSTGVEIELRLAQDETLSGRATAQLRDATIAFPAGMTLAPGGAEGLASCGEAEVACPPASKLGSAELEVPQLPGAIEGGLYLGSSDLRAGALRVWLISDQPALHLKIPGEIQVDPAGGQLTLRFSELPQIPFSDLKLHVFGGPRAPFAAPRACGAYGIPYELVPWSGFGAVASTAPMPIDRGCAAGGFLPGWSAATSNLGAGAFSGLILRLDRRPGEEDLRSLEVSLPEGVLANLKDVALCPEADTGAATCPASSRIGTATVAVGPGSAPLWLPQPGEEPPALYLAGPHEGAPYSLIARVPARAGPFDLGTVVLRAPIEIDPRSARVRILLDDLPQILAGIPIEYRTLVMTLDRPGFLRNPTSCEPMRVEALARSESGLLAPLSERFQPVRCAELPFRPRLSLGFSGARARNGHPAVRAVLHARGDEAGIASAAFTLPPGELLDLDHVRAFCPRALAPRRCPAASRLGRARLESPFLAAALRGPIYLREPSRRFPGVVADLRGGGLRLVLRGRTGAAPGGRLRFRLLGLPDVPLSRAVLQLDGGRRGIVVNSRALCERPLRAPALLAGQNGKTARLRPLVRSGSRC